MGKGKTSTLNGSAIRAHGAGMKVGVFRFLKGRKSSEDEVLKNAGIKVMSLHPSEKFVIEMDPTEKFKARDAVKSQLQYIINNQKQFDVIILDELIDVVDKTVNFLTETDLIEFLDCLKDKEILISGHSKLDRLFEKSDLITFYNSEKHYYDKGVNARRGIEF